MIDRYSRQTLFFPNGLADQHRLSQARVALVGCGALGTVIAGLLVRAGVGLLRVIDRDVIEGSNLQRQTLFDEEDIRQGLPKAIAAARKLGLVNSEVEIEPLAVDFEPDNAERLLGDVELILDGTDNFEIRYLINDAAVKLNKPWIYGGCIGGHGQTMTILPGETPCLRCIFPEAPPPGAVTTCDTAGVIGPIGGVIGSFASAEALKMLTGAHGQLRSGLLWLDVWNNSIQSTPFGGPVEDCPTCQRGRFEQLEGGAGHTSTLCGRSSVQVRPSGRREVHFAELGQRLQQVGAVSWNPHLLRFATNGYELTLFPDGRAIVKGTEDPAVARGLYARYIGV